MAALESGVSRANSAQNEGTGRFPQVSGLRFTWNPDNLPGERVEGVSILQADGTYAPIEPAATYKVVTNDFLRTGGDGYAVFAEYGADAYDFGVNLEEAVISYLGDHDPVAPQLEERIIENRSGAGILYTTIMLSAAALFAIAGLAMLIRRP